MSRFRSYSASLFCLASLGLFSGSAAAVVPPAPTIDADSYILMDYRTGHVIAERNADDQLGPASLTKMLTSYILGREIQMGNVSPTDMVTVSENAWARNFPGSSLMFIEVGRQVSVAELNKGIVISSGNDASVAIAEHISGSADAFADLMNAYADELGMHSSSFANPHGLPADGQVSTARDMAILAQALIRDVPEEFALYKEREFTYNDIRQYNRNSLLWDRSLNVDGLKTGHTSESGYSLVTTATDQETRLISVVMGTDSERARAAESKKLLTYGFRYFETVSAYAAGDSFATQRVWGGSRDQVELGVKEDVVVTLPRGRRQDLAANFVLTEELQAPIVEGTEVGTVFLTLDGEDIASFPLVALHEVELGSIFKRFIDNVRKSFAEEE